MSSLGARLPAPLSAGVIIVRGAPPEFLLARCYHYWDFPKGELETGETPLAAAQREVAEETALTALDFRWGPCCYRTPPYTRRGKIACYYLARLASPQQAEIRPNPQTGRYEHHELRWVAAEQARALLGPRVRGALEWALRLLSA